MYLPLPFEETRIDVLHALMRAHPLATLITLDEHGIVANHLPVAAAPQPAPNGVLRGHVARANPLWRHHPADQEVLAIFQGPQVYISPSFYPSKQATGEVVPTWNYAVVHVRGKLRFVEDSDWMRGLVSALTDSHEAVREAPWKLTDAPAPYVEKMLKAIVGFELSIESITGKWKVSQNRDAADRGGVISGLRASKDSDALDIADMLASRHPSNPLSSGRKMVVLVTPRLTLRRFELYDAPFILELLNEEDFLRFIGDKGVRTLADARDYLTEGPLESYRKNGFGLNLASLRSDGTPIGMCGLVKRDTLPDVDIGFAFSMRHWSKGYASESAAGVLAHGQNSLRLERIVAITALENTGSIAVLEKIGLRFERRIRLVADGPELNLFGTAPISIR